jgi:hypothetical protein
MWNKFDSIIPPTNIANSALYILIAGAIVGSIVYFATYFQNLHYDGRKSSIQGGKIY